MVTKLESRDVKFFEEKFLHMGNMRQTKEFLEVSNIATINTKMNLASSEYDVSSYGTNVTYVGIQRANVSKSLVYSMG